MKRTRIVKLLNILSKLEKDLLKKHIDCSDKDTSFKTLAKYLLANSNKPEMLDEDEILKAINKKMTLEKLGQLRFQLFQYVENFVLNNWLSSLSRNDVEPQVQKDFLLLDYYKAKELSGSHPYLNNLSKLIDFKQKQIQKILDKSPVNNIIHYYYLHRLNYHEYYGLNVAITNKGRDHIQATMECLDIFYALAKFKFSGEIMLRNMLTTEHTEIFGLELMSEYCNTLNKVNSEQPLINIYHLSSQLAINTNKESLKLLKNEILKNENSLDNNELSQLLTLVINYNTYISRHHDVDLTEASYELLSLGLKREIFNVNGLIRPDFLINFAYLCTEFSDEKEIVLLMKQYETRLSDEVKASTLNLCHAYIWWFRKDYKKAIAATLKKPKRTFIFFLFQKLMQIKCFYELSESEKFDVENDYISKMLKERSSLLKYLNNNESVISSYNFQALLKFTKMLLKLINPDYSKKQLFHLMKHDYKQIYERRWLLRKITVK